MRKYRIVIVENDEDEQFFMKEAFETSGLFDIVAQVKNGDELFEWLESHPQAEPEVILTDLNMPGKNGYDIINEIRTNPAYLHLPVIVTSTSSTKTIIDKCLNLGAADYLIKPETFIQYAPYVSSLHEQIQKRQLVK